MDKLNYTKEALDEYESHLKTWTSVGKNDIYLLLQDARVLHAELARLNKGLKEAVEEIDELVKVNSKLFDDGMASILDEHKDGAKHYLVKGRCFADALDILRRHLGKEDK